MVAKIISGKSLMGALSYNENKVKLGKAELIGESGYAKNIDMLTFNDKLFRLTDLASRNERVKTNTVHISLNFAVGEVLERDTLNEITAEYMDRIGFSGQPYLIYRHKDAGHPHVHIVSTNIKNSGERISLHNLGRTKSEEARKAIEVKYGLVQASKQEVNRQYERQPLKKVEYGEADTKRTITNIVNEVIRSYKFTSLPEFNAVLNLYNIAADRGSKESRMYSKNGLVYWVLDNQGKKLGVPIKASSIYGKPTLKTLDERFLINEMLRKPYKERIKQAINSVLVTKASKAGFQQAMQSKWIQVVFRHNEQGRLYGVTFVDQQLKVVFNGSDLGKAYSASAMNDRFTFNGQDSLKASDSFSKVNPSAVKQMNSFILIQSENDGYTGQTIFNDLLKNEIGDTTHLAGLIQGKRKKKRRHFTS